MGTRERLGIALLILTATAFSGCQRPSDPPQVTEATNKHSHDHGPGGHDDSATPKGVSGTPFERELFLSPGGVYSEADIKANGNTVPSAKYRGISWPHDETLNSGDKVCPVTANKADERCSWIVNAKKYEFCCTPCLDKFVKLAKEQPAKIKDPAEYIQK
jgi:hypothetical protein